MIPNKPYKEVLAYAAGIIDGEGWISLERNKTARKSHIYTANVSVQMTDQQPIKLLQMLFGGSIYYRDRKGNHQGIYQWRLTSIEDIVRCLQDVGDYLLVKRERCNIMLLYFKSIRRGEKNNKVRELFFLEMQELNLRGKAKNGLAQGLLNDIKD